MKLLEMPEFLASDLVETDISAMADMSRAIKNAFPVGKVWISFDETSPAEIIGGEWKKVEGRFLFAAGTCDTGETWDRPHAIGGSVSHRHLTSMGFDGLRMFGLYGEGGVPIYGSEVYDRRSGINVAKTSDISNERLRINYTAHVRNMPPFIVCYVWERVR